MTNALARPLELPCGATLPNRIAKPAMTEGFADHNDNPTAEHARLYERWSAGGAGLLVTGNVMVDRRYLERPGNVVIDEFTDREALRRWAEAGTKHGNHLWMQINHPGRQCSRMVTRQPVAPSAVQLNLGGYFGRPRELSDAEIREIIARFAYTAKVARETGFTGVQIHSAHGYLSSQFLSPRVNKRTDQWGGSLENRARFLLETLSAVRAAVGDDFPIGCKLNSADFSKGGFTNEEAAQVAAWLEERSLDLLEISGGTYESTVFLGGEKSPSSAREAYFLEYAKTIRAAISIPTVVTGGFRTRRVMEEVIDKGEVDVIGLARPLCVAPDGPAKLLSGTMERLPSPEDNIRLGPGVFSPQSSIDTLRAFNSQAGTAWFYEQIYLLKDGKEPDYTINGRQALARHFLHEAKKARQRRAPRA